MLREGTFIELLKNNIMRKMKEIETKPFKIYIFILYKEFFFIFCCHKLVNWAFLQDKKVIGLDLYAKKASPSLRLANLALMLGIGSNPTLLISLIEWPQLY